MVDGKGPLPDSNAESLAWLGIAGFVFLSFGVFTGLDAQAEFLVQQPSQYFLSTTTDEADIVLDQREVELLNSVSSRSLGSDAVASERLYCGGMSSNEVVNLRLADRIEGSSLTSVAGGCVGNIDFFIHTQPGFSKEFSREDKDLESENIEFSCIQWAEITSSPVSGQVRGLRCSPVVSGELKTGENLLIRVR